MLLITFADEYLGYCLTSHLAQHKHLRKEIRVLCQAKPSPCLANFRAKEINVCPIDYSHPNDLSKAMRNVDQMILCMSHHPDRVHHAQQLIKVASQSGVQSIIYLSHVGALTQYSALRDYGLVEKYLIQICQEGAMEYTIMRLDWIQQYFHYWSCQVEANKQLRMPLSLDAAISPVHITDLCEILSRFVIENDRFIEKLQEQHAGQVYTITGPDQLTPKQIIQQMTNATQFQGFKYQIVRPMDTLYYLKDLGHNIWFDERLKADERHVYQDPLDQEYLYKTKLLSRLEDKQIQTFLNYFEWVNQFSGSVSVEHTQQLLIDRKSSGLQVYFKENAIAFKPKV